MKLPVVPWIVVVGYERLFVNASADAVASEIRHYVEALEFDGGLYGSADAVERLVGPCPLEGGVQCRPSASSQPALLRGHSADAYGDGSVGEVAI